MLPLRYLEGFRRFPSRFPPVYPYPSGLPLFYWLPPSSNPPISPQASKFMGNCVYTYMAVYNSRCMAMAISAAVTNFQVAAFVANLLFSVFLLSSG